MNILSMFHTLGFGSGLLASVLVFRDIAHREFKFTIVWGSLFLIMFLCFVAWAILKHEWGVAVYEAFMAALYIWIIWWGSRKQRKRAKELLGAKSRALRDAIVRKAREAAQPRRVLRPVPVPVR